MFVIPVKGEVEKRGQTVVVTSHIWKHTMGELGNLDGDNRRGQASHIKFRSVVKLAVLTI